jgi:hypothetical protein
MVNDGRPRACNPAWTTSNAKRSAPKGHDPDDPIVLAALELVRLELAAVNKPAELS